MLLFDLIRVLNEHVTPQTTKVHLAGWNGTEDPLRVYLQGEFDEWQAWQTQKNFELPFVVSLIQMPERDQWLYVGAYTSTGQRYDETEKRHRYELMPVATCADLAGRLIVHHARSGRSAYRYADGIAEQLVVRELKPERIHLVAFPGFKKVDLGFDDLAVIARQKTTSWRVALSNVAGVYLVSDQEGGKLYVGSASGEGGLWNRWCQYADGHGNNV